jgi:predicted phage-related endonuclease
LVEWHAEAVNDAETGKTGFKRHDFPAVKLNGEGIVFLTITKRDGSFELERIIGVETKVYYDVMWGPVADGMATGSSGYFPPDYSV